MKVSVHHAPRFTFSISEEVLRSLKKLSKHHYDSTCRRLSDEAGKDGSSNGFLTIAGMHGDQESGKFNVYSATIIELDLCLKIMEMTSGLLTEQEKFSVEKFKKDLRFVLRRYSQKKDEWAMEIDTDSFLLDEQG